ncbi:MAG: hypothetical protein ABI130_14490 [Leifsonia sp.]
MSFLFPRTIGAVHAIVPADNVAVRFESDWSVLSWVIWSVVIAGAVALALSYHYFSQRSVPAAWLATGTASIVLLFSPGVAMRHVADSGNNGWVVLGGVLAAMLIVGVGFFEASEPTPYLAAGGALVAGSLFGWVWDWVNRAAASIPMTVGGFVLMLGLGAAALVYYSRR